MHARCWIGGAANASALTLSVAVSAMNTLLSGTPKSCAAICRPNRGSGITVQGNQDPVVATQHQIDPQPQHGPHRFVLVSAPGRSSCAGPAPSPRRRASLAPCHPCRLHSTTQPVLNIMTQLFPTELLCCQLTPSMGRTRYEYRAGMSGWCSSCAHMRTVQHTVRRWAGGIPHL